MLLIENDAELFDPAQRQHLDKSGELARRKPGNVRKPP